MNCSHNQPALGQEEIPPDEDKSIDTILELMRTAYSTQFPAGTSADPRCSPDLHRLRPGEICCRRLSAQATARGYLQ